MLLADLEQIRRPVEFIHSNYQNNIRVADIAKHAHLSVSSLERRFKKIFSLTPKQYITDIRLDKARRQILETDMSISDIAYLNGFPEHSYFSRLYKQTFAEQPSETRLRNTKLAV